MKIIGIKSTFKIIIMVILHILFLYSPTPTSLLFIKNLSIAYVTIGIFMAICSIDITLHLVNKFKTDTIDGLMAFIILNLMIVYRKPYGTIYVNYIENITNRLRVVLGRR